jgi:hypothetical protein
LLNRASEREKCWHKRIKLCRGRAGGILLLKINDFFLVNLSNENVFLSHKNSFAVKSEQLYPLLRGKISAFLTKRI